MKSGPVSKIDKKYNGNENDVMSANCDIIVISQIYDQFGSFCKPNSGRMVLLAFSLKVTLNLTKTENRTKKSLTQLSYHCFE